MQADSRRQSIIKVLTGCAGPVSAGKLAGMFGVSRQTIRHATGELVNEGLLTRVKGSGTYIGGAAEPALYCSDACTV